MARGDGPESRFAWEGDEVTLSQCAYCRHYRPGLPPSCGAFPGGIPDAILANEADHRKPLDGDHGVRFEPEGDADAATLARLYEVLDAD